MLRAGRGPTWLGRSGAGPAPWSGALCRLPLPLRGWALLMSCGASGASPASFGCFGHVSLRPRLAKARPDWIGKGRIREPRRCGQDKSKSFPSLGAEEDACTTNSMSLPVHAREEGPTAIQLSRLVRRAGAQAARTADGSGSF